VGGIERKETTRQRRVAGCREKTVLYYGIVNEEAWGKNRRIRYRKENGVGLARNSFEEAKGRERTEKERGGG
jgi:hypothetical protein